MVALKLGRVCCWLATDPTIVVTFGSLSKLGNASFHPEQRRLEDPSIRKSRDESRQHHGHRGGGSGEHDGRGVGVGRFGMKPRLRGEIYPVDKSSQKRWRWGGVGWTVAGVNDAVVGK